jgi:HK97 family phage major capsid protein
MARINAPTYAKMWSMPNDVMSLWDKHTAYSTTIPVVETDPAVSVVPAQTGGTMTSLYCADWSRVLIGMHLGMQTAVLQERYADQLQVGLLTYMRFSVRLSHPEGFVRSTGALTT